MNDKERELLFVACKFAWMYDDCNPDVGMGPTAGTIVERVVSELSFNVSSADQHTVADRLHYWYTRERRR